MKNIEQAVAKTKTRRYRIPLPKHLKDVTVDAIFEDSKHCIGLMSIFFEWSGKLLVSSWPGCKLQEMEFEDDFHDAFETLVKLKNKGGVRAQTPIQLYCLLRTIFRNIVYIRKMRSQNNIPLDDKWQLADTPFNKDNEPANLCMMIDKIVKVKDILTKSELAFWDIFKQMPDKKAEVMSILNLTSANYDSTKHRLLRKLNILELATLLF